MHCCCRRVHGLLAVAKFWEADSVLLFLCGNQYGIFLFFAGWVLVMTLFVVFLLPETKGAHSITIQCSVFLSGEVDVAHHIMHS